MTDNRETQIAKYLIEQGLSESSEVRIYDPEGILYRGKNATTALSALEQVEIAEVVFRGDGKTLGVFDIIWGNGDDIISDCTDNEWSDKLFRRTTATFGLI